MGQPASQPASQGLTGLALYIYIHMLCFFYLMHINEGFFGSLHGVMFIDLPLLQETFIPHSLNVPSPQFETSVNQTDKEKHVH